MMKNRISKYSVHLREKTMKLCLYSTGEIYNISRQTGGIKRFAELAEYVSKKFPNFMLYSRDEEEEVQSHDVKNFTKVGGAKKISHFLPPEFALWLSNLKCIQEIKDARYDNVIIFDAPTAIGPILSGLQNVILMIRKDMIGYEMVQNQSKQKWLKICFQWICESVCMYKSKRIITQCVYDKEVGCPI